MSKNVHTLMKYFIDKNVKHHLNLQQVTTFWSVESLASMLMATDQSGWWLLKAGVAVAISYSKTTVEFVRSVDSLFHEQFLCSMRYCLIAFYLQQNFFQSWGQFSSPTLLLLY